MSPEKLNPMADDQRIINICRRAPRTRDEILAQLSGANPLREDLPQGDALRVFELAQLLDGLTRDGVMVRTSHGVDPRLDCFAPAARELRVPR